MIKGKPQQGEKKRKASTYKDGTAIKRGKGKMDMLGIIEGLKAGKPKAQIARENGSLAKTTQGQNIAVNQVMKTKKFQQLASKHIHLAFDHMTEEKYEKANATSLATTIEKLSKVSGLATSTSDNPDIQLVQVNIDKVLNQYLKDDKKETN